MAKNIGVKLAQSVADNFGRMDAIVSDVHLYLDDVKNELRLINDRKALDPQAHALRSLLFALASPQNRFDANVIAARQLHAAIDGFHSGETEEIYQALTVGPHGVKLGTVTSGQTARSILFSLDYLRNLPAKDVYAQVLRSRKAQGVLWGAGMKVTAMAGHLNDEYDIAFTLDTHMLRGIMRHTLDLDGTWTIDGTAYAKVERAAVQWALSRFANCSPFSIQWAMWCVFRGTFDSHLAIFS